MVDVVLNVGAKLRKVNGCNKMGIEVGARRSA